MAKGYVVIDTNKKAFSLKMTRGKRLFAEWNVSDGNSGVFVSPYVDGVEDVTFNITPSLDYKIMRVG